MPIWKAETRAPGKQPDKAPRSAPRPNLTGIPHPLKAGFEAASGLSFDDVRVHYHSDRPAKLQALAYTQGNQVYLGSGQERHLSHELGHVVQQKQGRVRPNASIQGLPLNDSPTLEREASAFRPARLGAAGPPAATAQPVQLSAVVQRLTADDMNGAYADLARPDVGASLNEAVVITPNANDQFPTIRRSLYTAQDGFGALAALTEDQGTEVIKRDVIDNFHRALSGRPTTGTYTYRSTGWRRIEEAVSYSIVNGVAVTKDSVNDESVAAGIMQQAHVQTLIVYGIGFDVVYTMNAAPPQQEVQLEEEDSQPPQPSATGVYGQNACTMGVRLAAGAVIPTLKADFVYPVFSASQKHIICWNDSEKRDFRHELGHAVQKRDLADKFEAVQIILIEHQNVLENENKTEANLRLAYSKFYEFGAISAAALEAKKQEAIEKLHEKSGQEQDDLSLFERIFQAYGQVSVADNPNTPMGSQQIATLNPAQVPRTFFATAAPQAHDAALARKLQYNFCCDVVSRVR